MTLPRPRHWRPVMTALLCVLLPVAIAQAEVTSATDYFNLGASVFIRDNPEPALAIVNEGLFFHPDDEPLLRLKALLEQQDEQQQNQNQDQQNQDQDQQEQPEDSDQDQEQDPPEPPPEPEPEDDNADQPEQNEPQPEEMTDEEAEMMLDSLRQLEQALREQMMQEMIRRQMRNLPPVEKDW